MLKLLNRFAWFISIIIAIIPMIIDDDFIFFGIIAGLIVKFVFFSNNFIKERLEFFAESIKRNYIGNENSSISNKNNSPIIPLNKIEEDIEEKEIPIDLEKFEEKTEINTDFNTTDSLKSDTENNTFQVEDLENSKNYTQAKYEPSAFDIFFEKTGTYIKEFFSTNLLAKLGGILVFLAVVYLLKGVFLNMGPVAKLILGIFVGFGIYGTGVKIHGKYENEGLILMGIGILINFAVILSGRYLVGENGYLTEGTTFLFLILNTVFAVLTSLVYKSKTLLLFSFIFAYLNPILTGGSSDTPYTLIGYSLIVSLGALYLSIREANLTLLVISFIAGNLLFWQAPFSNSTDWSVKIIFTSVLSIISIISARKFKGLKLSVDKLIINLFIGTYIFIILNLLNSGNILSETISFIVYNFILVSLFIFSIKLIKKSKTTENFNYLNIFLFFPLIILIGILFTGNIIFSPFILIGTIIIYLIGFIFLQNLSNIFSYIFFGILAVFIFLFNLDIINFFNISASDPINLNYTNIIEFITIIITSLIFLLSTYYYSLKENLSKLFPIGTIGTILILSPIIKNTGDFMNLSIIAIIIFAISNLALPFINKHLFKKENLNSLIIGSLAGALFFAFQIYNFGEIHFSGITEGFAFLGLAIIYFMQGFFVGNTIGFENMKSDESLKNSFYTFIAISISLFSVSIAFVFSKYPEIITTTWLFEATILYFFYSQTSSQKIFWAASVLFIIGLTKFGILLDIVNRGDFKFLISFVIILASFILNLFFINKAKENNSHNFHHFFHLIGMAIMGGLLLEIIPSTGHGWSMLGISIFITILGYFYSKFNFNFLKISFLVIIGLFSALHIGELHSIFYLLEKDNLEYLKIMQYVVSGIIISSYLIWNKFNKNKNYNKTLLIIIAIYSFIISNLFILDLFENIFGYYTLTIYWGLIASALLIYGIQKDIIKYRTIGLYFLTLTSLKIFLYDVWQIGDTNSRVIVFAVLGVIFIVISTFYSKRFGDNMKGEFSLDNLKSEKNSTENSKTESPKISSNEKNTNKKDINNKYKKEESNLEKKEFIINKNIKNIKVGDTKSVQFIFNNNEKISIRATNLIKIVKLVIKELDGKTIYKKDELSSIYEYVKDNYKSEISKDNYNKIIKILERFVKEGGEIKLK